MRAKFSRKGSPLPGRTGLTTSGSSGENGTDRLEESNKRIAARLCTRERSRARDRARARKSERERERSGFNRAATANGPACSFLFFSFFFSLFLFFSFSLSFFFPSLFFFTRVRTQNRGGRGSLATVRFYFLLRLGQRIERAPSSPIGRLSACFIA